eukprot:1033371-Amorphochlora_amoeboformis.AAC.1
MASEREKVSTRMEGLAGVRERLRGVDCTFWSDVDEEFLADGHNVREVFKWLLTRCVLTSRHSQHVFPPALPLSYIRPSFGLISLPSSSHLFSLSLHFSFITFKRDREGWKVTEEGLLRCPVTLFLRYDFEATSAVLEELGGLYRHGGLEVLLPAVLLVPARDVERLLE